MEYEIRMMRIEADNRSNRLHPGDRTKGRTMQRNSFRYSSTVQINYEVAGHGEIPVVFIHGFAASLVTWHDIRMLFQEDRCRLFFIDLKGFGFSSKPRDDGYGVADQAEIVIAFVKAMGLNKVILVGHSLGGAVALRAVLESGQDISGGLTGGLVLLDCAAYPQRLPPLMRLLQCPLPAMVLMRIFPVSWIVYLTLKRVFHNRVAVTPARVRRYTGGFNRRGMARALVVTVRRIIGEEREIMPNYRDVSIPTLIIWGKEDRVTRLGQAYRLNGEIRGSRLEILDKCGHNPHEEYPDKTCRLIVDFIDRLRKGDKASLPSSRFE